MAKIYSDRKIKALKIVNIIFTILATAALVAAIVFFASGIDALNDVVAEGEVDLTGLGFAICFIFFIIAGIAGVVLSVVSLCISAGGYRQRKPESTFHRVWNIVSILALVAMFAVNMVINAKGI